MLCLVRARIVRPAVSLATKPDTQSLTGDTAVSFAVFGVG